jgi:RHS repeat-associated protein
LDYAVNRHYSSAQGRFTQVDPIGMGASSLSDPQTLNMYAYCANDPINHVDPNGLFFGWLKKFFSSTIGKIVVAVALIVLTAGLLGPLAAQSVVGGFSIGGGATATVVGATHLTLLGWATVGLSVLSGVSLPGGFGGYGGFRTPSTFPKGTGVGGVSNFLGSQQGALQQGKKSISVPVYINVAIKISEWLVGDVNPKDVKPMPGSTGDKPPYGPCDSFMGINANHMYRYGGDGKWGQYVRAHLLEDYKLLASPGAAHRHAWVSASISVGPIETAKGLGAAVYNGAGSYLYQSGRYVGERALRQVSSVYSEGFRDSVTTQAFPCRNDVK